MTGRAAAGAAPPSPDGGVRAEAHLVAVTLVVLGASWGGLRALEVRAERAAGGVRRAGRRRPAPPGRRRELLAGLLDAHTALDVRDARDGDAPRRGPGVLVAPAGYHVLVEGDHFALSREAEVRFSRPSIDVRLESAADALGPGVVGVVLTGDNDDGAAGWPGVRARAAGYAIVQDPATARRARMPAAALAAGAAADVAELPEIAALLVALVGAARTGAMADRPPSCWSTTGPRTCSRCGRCSSRCRAACVAAPPARRP